ncbi:MAG: hypothetical protein R2751_15855 [Bacteroidales bacterium]
MHEIDLESYKRAWQSEPGLRDCTLGAEEIGTFLKASSRNLRSGFRKGLLFDVGFKGILLAALAVLLFGATGGTRGMAGGWGLVPVLALGMAWQLRALWNLPGAGDGTRSVLEGLRTTLDYSGRHYLPSLYVSALSSALFFVIGSLVYLVRKYGAVPPMQTDDVLVLAAGIVLSFVLSARVQVGQHNFRIRQLEQCMRDAEEETLTGAGLAAYHSRRRRNVILLTIAFLVGLVLLVFLLFLRGAG